MLRPVQRQNLSDQVFGQLRDKILSRDFAPGARLPSERELCDRLGVNRSSVREALKRLEQARLVRTRHGEGSVVLDFQRHAGLDLLRNLVGQSGELDPHVVRSVFELRSLIGPELGRLAAQRVQAAELASLADTVAKIEASAPDDARTLQALDFEFYYFLAQASENLALALLYNTVRDVYEDMAGFFTAMFVGVPPDSLHLYREVLQALRQGDSALAARLCARQIEDAHARFLGTPAPKARQSARKAGRG